MSTEDIRPGAQEFYAMHGGSDAWRTYTMYGTWDDANQTGEVIDLTGATLTANFFDADGNLVFTADAVTVDAPTTGLFIIKPGKTNTIAHAETEFEDGMMWGLHVVWSDASESIEMYGGWDIGKDLTV